MGTTTDAFVDIGLRFAVLDAFLVANVLDEEDLRPLFEPGVSAALEHFPDDLLEGDGRTRINESVAHPEAVLGFVYASLGSLAVTDTQLAAITSLNFDAGNVVYAVAESMVSKLFGLDMAAPIETGGLSSLYYCRGLDGLDLLPNLIAIDFFGYGLAAANYFRRGDPLDVEPLASLPSLMEIRSIDERYVENIDKVSHLIS